MNIHTQTCITEISIQLPRGWSRDRARQIAEDIHARRTRGSEWNCEMIHGDGDQGGEYPAISTCCTLDGECIGPDAALEDEIAAAIDEDRTQQHC